MKLSVVNVFCEGDSSNIDTWSNLPFFFTQALEKQNIKVNRINLAPFKKILDIFYKVFWAIWCNKVMRLLKVDYQFQYNRCIIHEYIANTIIKKACKIYSDADLNIFLSFSYSSYRISKIPVVHYCDQLYIEWLEENNTQISRIHNRLIKTQKNNLINAFCIFSTNKHCQQYISTKYQLKSDILKSAGIALDVDAESIIKEDLFKKKKNTKNILFIGKGYHKRGVDILIKAFSIFNLNNKNEFTLNIVGIKKSEIGQPIDKINVYEYLSKRVPYEFEKYIDLLKSAMLFVMPMRQGPPPGVVKECFLFYIPVLLSNIWGVDRIVENNYNGVLENRLDPEIYAMQMDKIVNNLEKWWELAENAHESSKKYSWENGVKEMLQTIITKKIK